MLKIAYLGPLGTHTERAANTYFLNEQDKKMVSFRSISTIFDAVKDGKVQFGVVPIENSIEGSVNQTLDLLAQEEGLQIKGEIILPIKQALMSKKETSKRNLTKLVSHLQALAQCSRFIEKELADIQVVETLSTAEAAEIAVNSEDSVGVIGHPDIAEIYGLSVLESNIANCTNNKTRFIIIGKEDKVIAKANKTTLMISITDRPGGLYQVLKEFALKNINLTKIESRPSKSGLGDYIFFVDFIGTPNNKNVANCLKKVNEISASFRILGSYRGNEEQGKQHNRKPALSLEQVRQDIDIIDRQIIELLAKRTELVTIVGSIKKPEKLIRDHKRERNIINKLTYEAHKRGVSPNLIKKLYLIMFDHFVNLQEKQRNKKSIANLYRNKSSEKQKSNEKQKSLSKP